jgi:CBS domain-containing protein
VIVENGEPTGFVTDRDLAISVVADGRSVDDRACDHASTPVVTAAPDMELHEAAELMVRHRIQRLPVLDGPRLTGIVTLTDLAVRTGDLELAHDMTTEVMRAGMPDFYFHQRGG